MLNIIDDYLLIEIMKFLDNKSSLYFVLTSKYFKNLFKRNGFMKHLYINTHDGPVKLMNLYSKHYKSLYSINIHNVSNPQNWIFGNWSKKMQFYNCTLSDKIQLKNNNFITEELYIINYFNLPKILINWKNFPNLKLLFLKVFDIELNGLQYCNNLEIIYIETFKNKNNKQLENITTYLNQLTNLKYIFIDCFINEDYIHSKKIIKCFTCKDKIFNLEGVYNNYIKNF